MRIHIYRVFRVLSVALVSTVAKPASSSGGGGGVVIPRFGALLRVPVCLSYYAEQLRRGGNSLNRIFCPCTPDLISEERFCLLNNEMSLKENNSFICFTVVQRLLSVFSNSIKIGSDTFGMEGRKEMEAVKEVRFSQHIIILFTFPFCYLRFLFRMN